MSEPDEGSFLDYREHAELLTFRVTKRLIRHKNYDSPNPDGCKVRMC
jgi:hypothetical protein